MSTASDDTVNSLVGFILLSFVSGVSAAAGALATFLVLRFFA